MIETKSEEQGEDEYTIFLLKSEKRIRAFLLRLLHESVKLYGNITPKIKEKDRWYGIDDLLELIAKINELSSCREVMMGEVYFFDHE